MLLFSCMARKMALGPVVEEEVKEPEPPIVEEVKSATISGNSGVKIKTFDAGCADGLGKGYSFYITPEKYIELSEFTVYSNNCGGLEIELESTEGKYTMTSALNPGKNQILLYDLYPELSANIRYKVSLKTVAGYGNCSSSDQPKLLDTSPCGGFTSYNGNRIKTEFKGKQVIFNLKYLY